MTLNDFQDAASKTCKPNCDNAEYLILGLCSEAGEVADKRKKFLRDSDKTSEDAAKHRREIIMEVFDCLWYASQVARFYGYTLDDVASMGLEKLTSRKQRGVIEGSGDNR